MNDARHGLDGMDWWEICLMGATEAIVKMV